MRSGHLFASRKSEQTPRSSVLLSPTRNAGFGEAKRAPTAPAPHRLHTESLNTPSVNYLQLPIQRQRGDATPADSSREPLQLKRKKKGPSVQERLANMGRRARRRWFQQQREQRRLRRDPEARERIAQAKRTAADQTAWEASLTGAGPLLPHGRQHDVRPDERGLQSLGLEADTTFPRGRTLVRYDPSLPSQRNMNRRIGALAQTLTHELAVHGRNAPREEADPDQDEPDPDVEHREMHGPETRKDYLDATHRTFNQLANPTQKKVYANVWHGDMNNQIAHSEVYDEEADEDVGLTKEQKQQRRTWALQRRNSMIDAIANPAAHPWTEDD